MTSVGISMHDKSHAETVHFCSQANLAQSLLKFRHFLVEPGHRRMFAKKRTHAHLACQQAFALKRHYGLADDDVIIMVIEGNLHDDGDDEYFCAGSQDDPHLSATCPGTAIISLYYLKPQSTFMKEKGNEWRALSKPQAERLKADSILLNILAAVTMEVTGIDAHDSIGCVLDYCQEPSDLMESLKAGFQFCETPCKARLSSDPLGAALLQIATQLKQHPYRLAPSNFAFVRNDNIREIIERDYAELQSIKTVPSVKSRLILAGGLIEGLLLDALAAEDRVRALPTGSGRGESLNNLGLEKLLNAAVDMGLISNAVQQLGHAVRDYRNLVHPGKEIRSRCKVAPQESDIAEGVLEIVIRDLRRNRRG